MVKLSCKFYKMRMSLNILLNCDNCDEGSNIQCGIHVEWTASVYKTFSKKDIYHRSRKPSSSRDHVQCLFCQEMWRNNNVDNLIYVDECSPRTELC